MYLGKIVELADKESLYKSPLHPYTKALLSAIPVPDPTYRKERIILGGNIPSPINPPSGCPFHPRCRYSMDICYKVIPALMTEAMDIMLRVISKPDSDLNPRKNPK